MKIYDDTKILHGKKIPYTKSKDKYGLGEKLILAQRHDITPNIHEAPKN